MIVLCIGGPKDGQRVEVRDRRAVIVGVVNTAPGVFEPFRYLIDRVETRSEHKGSTIMWVARWDDMTIEDAMARLIAGYPCAIGTP